MNAPIGRYIQIHINLVLENSQWMFIVSGAKLLTSLS